MLFFVYFLFPLERIESFETIEKKVYERCSITICVSLAPDELTVPLSTEETIWSIPTAASMDSRISADVANEHNILQ